MCLLSSSKRTRAGRKILTEISFAIQRRSKEFSLEKLHRADAFRLGFCISFFPKEFEIYFFAVKMRSLSDAEIP